jgi:hypothetical protein
VACKRKERKKEGKEGKREKRERGKEENSCQKSENHRIVTVSFSYLPSRADSTTTRANSINESPHP